MAKKTITLDLKTTPSACETRCPTCGENLQWEGPGRYACQICTMAADSERTVEEVRAEVEDLAHSVNPMFARASGARCTCGSLEGCDHAVVKGRKGEPPAEAIIHFEGRHDPSCPLSPGTFDWHPINEDWRAFENEQRGEKVEVDARGTIAYLAREDNWLGDPRSHGAVLLGHFTPYELARHALGFEEDQSIF